MTTAQRAPFTARETQILHAVRAGKTNRQIARELYLSENTIKTHLQRLFRKLGASNRAQAVALAADQAPATSAATVAAACAALQAEIVRLHRQVAQLAATCAAGE